jgi:putative acetyltransferase
MPMFSIRRAVLEDIEAVVHLQDQSVRETLGIKAHTLDEDFDFYTNVVFKKCTVVVAEAAGSVIGYIGYRTDWIDHLRVDSRHHGIGVGTALLNEAKRQYPYLQLWCFQHIPARRFYLRRGFVEVELTDGRDNEEKLPDVRMERRGLTPVPS